MVLWKTNKNIEKIKDKEYFVTEVNASKFKGYKNLIEEFSLAFLIPSTISNLDALNEYLCGLEWIEQKNYKLIIKNMNKVEKNKNDYEQFHSIIEGVENHWKDKESDFIVEYVGNS